MANTHRALEAFVLATLKDNVSEWIETKAATASVSNINDDLEA
jgi:hypothetical protein